MSEKRFIVSGGGTGGHIFPAISIANAIKEEMPDAEILFVGAKGRMEMERVPAAGYRIVGLPISGFDRSHLWRNVKTLYNVMRSMVQARRLVREFRPDVAVGVGGYASGPLLRAAAQLGVPCLIQEQNSYAGVTNKLLSRKAKRICVAYKGMERFFPAEKILLTGNPVRQNLFSEQANRREALAYYALSEDRPVVLVVGGSLGARTINESLLAAVDRFEQAKIQVLWQTGRVYYASVQERLKGKLLQYVHITEFVDRMDLAYAMADVVVSRAGASSISELCLLSKAVVLVPSPNVAEDHQTKNALALVNEDAAVMVRDAEARDKLADTVLELLDDPAKRERLSINIRRLAQEDSARRIALEVINLIK